LHPIRKNYKGSRSNDAEAGAWKQFQHLEFVHLLGSDQTVDPILLAKKAAANIGFRTSLTAQAMYLALPTIITGNVPWRDDKVNSNFANNSRELAQAVDTLLNGEQDQFDLGPIFKWAYYQAVCGSKMIYTHFTPGSTQLIINDSDS
jgi:hypothetical protein